ncbi:MAG: proline--tRNA ligase [Anaerolineae bacterium]|nr:proline--tRNA ligase [Anaerolineae bacterium]MDQ7033293.1 proline--tRNA ligase [Anaerolineae bacterium]
MRMSRLFSQTLREAPAGVDIVSHQLLLRAGYIRQLGAGIFSYLPLAQRSLTKIENIIREEMEKIGGQEITMPVVHPAQLWKETNRWYKIGAELTRFTDRNETDMVLAMTHEEVIADLIRNEIQSYKQLPVLLYQLQTKWRDEPRARGGLIRVREFTMKDSYSLDKSWDGLDEQYLRHYQAYFDIYHRCGLDVICVSSDTGMMGGKLAHEFMYLTPIGEDTLMVSDETGYRANREVAIFQKPPAEAEAVQALEKVHTPNTKTIESLADFLNIPKSKTAKAVFIAATILEAGEEITKLVFAIVRGDMDLNEIKLANALKAKAMRAATEAEIEAVGAVPGFASPIGIKDDSVIVVVDDAIPDSPNLVAGANEVDYHYKNVNLGRDYEAHIITDIVSARDGDTTADGKGTLKEVRGVEVGNIFKLGTDFTEPLGATFLDENGERHPVIMGSYGIGVGRLLACVAEEHHDDNGLKLPMSIAPYQVHLVMLPGGETAAIADEVYQELVSAGIEVLYDDRDERAGVKFNDADLIGIPLRLTLSKRSLKNGGLEFKQRDSQESRIIEREQVVETMKAEIQSLMDGIKATVVTVPYEA